MSRHFTAKDIWVANNNMKIFKLTGNKKKQIGINIKVQFYTYPNTQN